MPAGWTRARACRRILSAAVRWLESDEDAEASGPIRLQTWSAPLFAPHIVNRWKHVSLVASALHLVVFVRGGSGG